MPEPVTTALALAGLGWMGNAIAGGIAGNASDRVFCDVLRGVKDRVAGLRGHPENQTVAQAVRTAQVQALERLIRDYEEVGRPEWTSEPHTRPEMFLKRSLAFCARAVGRSRDPRIKLNLEVSESLTATIDGILAPPARERPAEQRADALAAFAENTVLNELRDVLDGVCLPDGFEAHFRNGVPGHARFLDLFGAYIAEQLKENEPFRAIFTTGQLSHIEGLAFDATELLTRIKARFGGSLQKIEATTDKISATQDAQGHMLEELLAMAKESGAFQRAAERGIPEAAVRAVVERLGGEGIGRDDLIPWLGTWTNTAQRELGKQTNEGEAFEAARREAERRFKQGRLADASAAFMDAFAHEERDEQTRREERKRRRLRLLEAAIRFDELAFNGEAAVQKLRIVADIEGISGSDALGGWLFDKAGEFYERGDRRGDNAALIVAISTYRAALEEYTHERVPLQWAMTQNNLGNALRALGERESGTQRLEEGVTAYRAALEEYTRERDPLQWAMTQNNLGTALRALGGRESGTQRLEEAVTAYRGALEERTRERVPLDWAMTQNNLGNALWTLGERESGTQRLEEAVTAYRAALEERTRERVPLDWAMTQNNLGNALWTLGEREKNLRMLREAHPAVSAAFEVFMEAGQEQYRADFENRLREIDTIMADLT